VGVAASNYYRIKIDLEEIRRLLTGIMEESIQILLGTKENGTIGIRIVGIRAKLVEATY
jgi:hypothetical protein